MLTALTEVHDNVHAFFCENEKCFSIYKGLILMILITPFIL